MIIDLHCHTAGIGAGNSGCFVSPPLRRNWRYGWYLKAFGVSEQELEADGDGLVIQRLAERLAESHLVDGAVVLALDGVIGEQGTVDYEQTEVYIPNDFVAKETAKYDNLYFGASINPYRPDAIERLEQTAGQGAILLKWLPSIQYIDPADPALPPFYRKLKELNLPLLTHTGHERSFSRAKHHFADPKKLELPLKLGVTVIAAHAASSGSTEGQDNMERLLPLFQQYPNLYSDISSLTQINKLGELRRLLKHKDIHEQLLYATDMPLINTLLVSPWYFPFDLSFREMARLSRINNPWDRDVQLKEALGVGKKIFARPYDLFLKKR